ncbi:MAG: hypothetical protein LBT68_06155 [Spirochaetales bacterium]|jgi:hypothetical protein|nr:hypothetical protein [Spirochaetales bacterium]
MRKIKLFLLICTVILAVSFCTACSSGGDDGNSPPTVEIGSAEDLQKIGSSGYPLNAVYELQTDIVVTGNWIPIGAGSNKPFTGTFKGNGYSVTLSDPDTSAAATITLIDEDGSFTLAAVGFFAYTKDGGIENLEIITNFIGDVEMDYALSHFGVVAGYAENTRLKNVTVSGNALSVKGTNANYVGAGGIVGVLTGNSVMSGKPP